MTTANDGDALEIAFYVSDKDAREIENSVISPIKIDGIEQTRVPRLDLTFRE